MLAFVVGHHVLGRSWLSTVHTVLLQIRRLLLHGRILRAWRSLFPTGLRYLLSRHLFCQLLLW